MKQRKIIRKIILSGSVILLFCFFFALSAAAIDTPWVTLQPDSETTGEPDGNAPVTTNAASVEPETAPAGATEGTPAGEETVSTAPNASSAVGAEAPQTNSPAPEPTKKRGCGSTASGTIVCVPLLFSALYIGRSVSLKRE